MKMLVIKENKIKCNHCGDIITSEYRHDFKMCSCGKVGIDGGKSYLRRIFATSPEDFEDLSITVEEEFDEDFLNR